MSSSQSKTIGRLLGYASVLTEDQAANTQIDECTGPVVNRGVETLQTRYLANVRW